MILEDLGLPVLSLKDAGITADVEENGTTFEENAQINVDAMPPLPLAAAEQAAEEAAGLLRRFTGAKTTIHKLTAEAPRFVL